MEQDEVMGGREWFDCGETLYLHSLINIIGSTSTEAFL